MQNEYRTSPPPEVFWNALCEARANGWQPLADYWQKQYDAATRRQQERQRNLQMAPLSPRFMAEMWAARRAQ